jgi:hypothetical protein
MKEHLDATTSTESGLIGSPSLCITHEKSAMRNAITEWTSLVLTTREISYKASPKIRAAEVLNDWMTKQSTQKHVPPASELQRPNLNQLPRTFSLLKKNVILHTP